MYASHECREIACAIVARGSWDSGARAYTVPIYKILQEEKTTTPGPQSPHTPALAAQQVLRLLFDLFVFFPYAASVAVVDTSHPQVVKAIIGFD